MRSIPIRSWPQASLGSGANDSADATFNEVKSRIYLARTRSRLSRNKNLGDCAREAPRRNHDASGCGRADRHRTAYVLKATRRGAVAHLRLTRSEKRNALDDVTVLGLEAFFSLLPKDIRAVVLTGEGQHFSAGLDLSEVAGEQDPLEGVLHSRMWHRAFEAIQFGPVPVIVALHGAVVGGGLELAASTHIRVAERSTYYGLPEGQRGIFLGGG